jgi:hypothetical protein
VEDDFGYVYSSAVEMKNGNTKWRCSKRNAFKCLAFINTHGDYIVKAGSEHNHDPTNVHNNRSNWVPSNYLNKHQKQKQK